MIHLRRNIIHETECEGEDGVRSMEQEEGRSQGIRKMTET